MTAPKWPESVPVLTAEDICRGRFHGPDDTHCLMGWCQKVAGFHTPHPSTELYYDLCDALHDEVTSISKLSTIPSFNDRTPKAQVAEVWNATMRRLGYTEVEDA